MLRPCFQRHRALLKCLCALAHQSLTAYLRTALGLPDAHPALVLTLHTLGEYLDFHPHLHALVADGLFTRDGTFHPLPPLPLKPLEELFRAQVLKLLVTLKLLPPERVQVLLSWKHSGFNVHHGAPVPPEHQAELEKLAQYILRNPFSVEKMTMESPTDTVIYRSRLNPKIHRNFEVFTPTDFLAAITQHRRKSEVRSTNVEARPAKTTRSRCRRFPNSSFVIRHSPFVSPRRRPRNSPPRNGATSSSKSGTPTLSFAPTARSRCA